MKTATFALGLLVSCAAWMPLAPAGDPLPAPNGKPVDTSFLKKYAETRRFMLGRPQNPKVAPDGKTVLFLRAEADKPTLKLFEFDVATGKCKELLAPATLLKGGEENLSAEEKARRERMRLSTGGFADFHFDTTGKNVLLPLSGKLFVFERATGTVTELKTGEGGAIVDPKWSPDDKMIAYVRGFDVYVIDLATNTEAAVTKGGTAIKTHGLAEFVAQEEMGRFTGYWWSPDSKHLAYEEADHTGVETWFVADPFKPGQKPAEQYYPRPGKKNVSVRLGVIPVEGGQTVWMKWPEPDQNRFREKQHFEYLTRVVWDKYGPLLVQLQTRSQELVSAYKVDHLTGEAEWVFDIEAFGHWVNLKNLYLKWTAAGRLGTTIGNARGTASHKREDLFRIDGRVDNFETLVHFDPETCETLFTGTGLSTDMHLFRSEGKPSDSILDTRSAKALTRGRGVFSATGNGKVICLTETTATAMPTTRVISAEGTLFGELPSVAANPEFKPNIEFLPGKPPFLREDVAFDGALQGFQHDERLFAMAVVRPRNFDPAKKYPVIVDVYGGPGHVHVSCAMRNWLVPQWLADRGFIVVAIDNRGTPARGDGWEKAISKKFGTVPLEDQVKGLHQLCDKFPELDRDRVGIVGWSFGGYMAANGVLRQPDVFKAAVAGAPVTDWEDYDTHYTERYMGLLPESKKAYDEASLLPLAKDLKRPLLLVHGTADDNVYFRHTLKLADALFRAGRDFEVLPLPGVTHMYTSDPVVMERLWAKTAGFFKAHLGEPK